MKRSLVNLALFLAVVVILGGAAWAARRLYETRPRAERREPPPSAALVEVMRVTLSTEQTHVQATGTVIPARTISLRAEVPGRIVEKHPALLPGGRFAAGETIARIFAEDYALAVEQQKGAVERARSELELEKGRSVVARREWDQLKKDVVPGDASRALALREPQLRNAEAALAAAQSALDLARINLERTVVKAPFNALVREEFIDLGGYVTPQTPLATLVGTDAYWVRVSVPVDRLSYIRLPGVNAEEGSSARVRLDAGEGTPVEFEGRVIRLMSDIEPAGRLARVLVEARDPLRLRSGSGMPLLLDAYVHVAIEGKRFENVAVVPRTALREGDRVWLMNERDELEERPVEIVWRREESVLVGKGLSAGERVVVGGVPSPVPGMKLRAALPDQGARQAQATARLERNP